MSVKVAINGFGRIGRLALRVMEDDPEFEVVAINSMSGPETAAYLLKYDTAQGRFKEDLVKYTEDAIVIDGREVAVFTEREAVNLPWGELGIDVVLECSGFYTSKEKSQAHIDAGAKKVVISAPASGDMKTVVYNVNDDILDGSETIISGASCTTNCLAPIVKVLDDKFGIIRGYMTTVHAFTNDQNTLDGSHKKGIHSRRGRTAAGNMVPTTTGAATALGKVIPHLDGKLGGAAIRVPTVTGSCIDLMVRLKTKVEAEDINRAMKEASNETLGYTEDPIVSSDCIGMHYGSLFDSQCTTVMTVDGYQIIKVLAWYDNEMSYTAQLVRTCKKISNI
ncbi:MULTISPECIES: type I glyceraldehyde-3-phosphate dehydrogenase [Psychrilyobacter]|uniref:Glyceraldehyde-3-phosphate dehydrogenase n=1 Tax=Psychrilyobacter piezotolerans TaxID=2293438 RepID=A0ABX9KHR8_9FUSO|nr:MULTISPECIES: type I glyceraldehyde-3-phosphate dehydrogenase [Psychrilyobacter]MCS5420316.1 type I glyceraldehyde-3-phosphate dehydrogenase [Psychrilyobacter sp. S5]NDI78102.1 type I glyceraldehyde-3-phosphate dehydrogenase [Psychrilyobacter piezotolerans]RDE61690.1 type I glyceraldehyde-3-phosphate dehydrogenase [Psychrilyobacter sp. S5]REI41082.1 type I glyceraldehyde-3-phosphate dehydrogenase [Psychrilyobacter piezotolerans]